MHLAPRFWAQPQLFETWLSALDQTTRIPDDHIVPPPSERTHVLGAAVPEDLDQDDVVTIRMFRSDV